MITFVGLMNTTWISVDRELMKKIWYTYQQCEDYFSHWKEWNNAAATTWVDLEIIVLNEIRDRDIQISHDIPYIWKFHKYHMISSYRNLKKWYKWTSLQNRKTDLFEIRSYGYWGEG